MANVQIGIVGGYSDLKHKKEVLELARELGRKIAERGWIIVCGGEKQAGVVREVMRGAKERGGLIVGVLHRKEDKAPEVNIWIDVEGKYGLREYILAISSDILVVIDGGSGTLNEIAVAYQNNIPIIALKGTGGWADKLANSYLDSRNKVKIVAVESVDGLIRYIENYFKNKDNKT